MPDLKLAVATAKRVLSHNVQRFRKRRHLTQKEAAQLAGIHWRHWQKIEAGEVNLTIRRIVAVAAALETTIPELFTERRAKP